jgi:hypothetical protein
MANIPNGLLLEYVDDEQDPTRPGLGTGLNMKEVGKYRFEG